MIRSIAWFAQNSVAANLLMVLLLAGGLLAAPTIRQELIPEISLDTIAVSVAYPGASPSEIEESVCVRVEEALQGLGGIDHIRSVASEGAASVTVQLLAGEDVRKRMDEVRSRVDGLDTLPEEAERPRVSEVTLRHTVLAVAVWGPVDEHTLKRVGQDVRDDIAGLPGVTDVELYGARPYEIAIEVSEASLRRFGLRIDDVVSAVRSSSLDLPGGSVQTSGGEILLRTRGQAYTASEFGDLPLVSRADGTRLTVGDVARVSDGFAETDQRLRFDGRPTVLVQVSRVGDQRELEISETVRGYVEASAATLPAGIGLTVWNDSSQVLRDRLETMLDNGASGFLLVVLVLACFLRLRLALWVSVGIPVAFLGSVAVMPVLGMSINFISLLGFIVVLGIVVDDAIVVGENAHTEELRLGDRLQGAISGAQSIAIPVVFGVLTTVAAFAPMLFLPGPQGRMTRVVPVIVIACLLFSLLEAMWILPAHIGHSGGSASHGAIEPRFRLTRAWATFQAKVAGGLRFLIDDLYTPALARALEWRRLTLALGLSMLILTLGLLGSGLLRFVFQSPVEADVIVVDVTMPHGTPAEVTQTVVERIEREAVALQRDIEAQWQDGRSVFTHRMAGIGEQPFRAQAASGPLPTGRRARGGHLGEIQINLSPADERDASAAQLTQALRDRVGAIPGVEEISFTSSMMKMPAPIEIRLRGDDLLRLELASEELKSVLAHYPGVYDIASSFRRGKQELELRMLPSGEALGVTVGDLAQQVRQGFYGVEAQTLQRGRDEVSVMVRYPASERRSLADVEGMRIRTPDGGEVPFAAVARAQLGRGFSSIARSDRRRVVNVTAEVDVTRANANEIVADLEAGPLDEVLARYPEITASFEGDQAEQAEFLDALARGQVIALLAIYALLAVPLRSYVRPLIIMSAIPFGLIGAAWGHVLLGYDFNMYSVVGLVALSGVVVNASLVLVDAIERLRAAGASSEEAVVEAGRARLRPIFLTSITTFVGLTPLMLESSMQAQFMVPMAISISFGVLFASFITLFLVPAGYLLLEDARSLLRRPASTAAPPQAAIEGHA